MPRFGPVGVCSVRLRASSAVSHSVGWRGGLLPRLFFFLGFPMWNLNFESVMPMVQYYLAPYTWYFGALLGLSIAGVVWYWLRRGTGG